MHFLLSLSLSLSIYIYLHIHNIMCMLPAACCPLPTDYRFGDTGRGDKEGLRCVALQVAFHTPRSDKPSWSHPRQGGLLALLCRTLSGPDLVKWQSK